MHSTLEFISSLYGLYIVVCLSYIAYFNCLHYAVIESYIIRYVFRRPDSPTIR